MHIYAFVNPYTVPKLKAVVESAITNFKSYHKKAAYQQTNCFTSFKLVESHVKGLKVGPETSKLKFVANSNCLNLGFGPTFPANKYNLIEKFVSQVKKAYVTHSIYHKLY